MAMLGTQLSEGRVIKFSRSSRRHRQCFDSEGHVPGAWSKIYGGEMCVDVVYTCMRIMGVNSYDRDSPLEKLMREALCFPIYDAGNIGMQRRKIHGVMAHESFNPRAFLESEPMIFTKAMDGIDTSPNIEKVEVVRGEAEPTRILSGAG